MSSNHNPEPPLKDPGPGHAVQKRSRAQTPTNEANKKPRLENVEAEASENPANNNSNNSIAVSNGNGNENSMEPESEPEEIVITSDSESPYEDDYTDESDADEATGLTNGNTLDLANAIDPRVVETVTEEIDREDQEEPDNDLELQEADDHEGLRYSPTRSCPLSRSSTFTKSTVPPSPTYPLSTGSPGRISDSENEALEIYKHVVGEEEQEDHENKLIIDEGADQDTPISEAENEEQESPLLEVKEEKQDDEEGETSYDSEAESEEPEALDAVAHGQLLRINDRQYQLDLEAATDLLPVVRLNEHMVVSMRDFEILRLLGKGAYGRVHLVRKLTGHDAGQVYAMKSISKIRVIKDLKTAEHMKIERMALEAVQGATFLVGLHYAFNSRAKLHLVLDFVCGGEMYSRVKNLGWLGDQRVRLYIAELVMALQTLHEKNIIYRDIKLENVLIDGDGNIVLADMGIVTKVSERTGFRAFSYCGTMEYMAPEILSLDPAGYGKAVDWWAVGVLTFELLTGATPFGSPQGSKDRQTIQKRIQTEQPRIPKWILPTTKDFLLKMLEKDPQLRLGGGERGAEEILEHPFFRTIDVQKLRAKQCPMPYRPTLKAEDDVQHFDSDFTDQEAEEDVECPALHPDIWLYRDYAYVAPQHLLEVRRQNEAETEFRNPGLEDIPLRPDDLGLGDMVSSGTFGTCYVAEGSSTLTQAVAKVIHLSNFRTSEIDALSSCCHPNIVKYLATYRNKCQIWIMTEHLTGEELTELRNLDEYGSWHIFRQLVAAVAHLQELHFIHGDLKPENIKFQSREELTVKLVDFGNASYCSHFETWQDIPRYTLDYAPPELLADPEVVTYSPAVDIYGLGATLYAMVVGHRPYRDGPEDLSHSYSAQSRLRERIEGGRFNLQATRWLNASETFKDLVAACLARDPEDRPSLEDILRCEWMQYPPEEKQEDALVEVKQEVEEVEELEETEAEEEAMLKVKQEFEEVEELEETEEAEKKEELEAKLEIKEEPKEVEEKEELEATLEIKKEPKEVKEETEKIEDGEEPEELEQLEEAEKPEEPEGHKEQEEHVENEQAEEPGESELLEEAMESEYEEEAMESEYEEEAMEPEYEEEEEEHATSEIQEEPEKVEKRGESEQPAETEEPEEAMESEYEEEAMESEYEEEDMESEYEEEEEEEQPTSEVQEQPKKIKKHEESEQLEDSDEPAETEEPEESELLEEPEESELLEEPEESELLEEPEESELLEEPEEPSIFPRLFTRPRTLP